MPGKDLINQSSNIVKGDLAAGDIHKTTNIFAPGQLTPLQILALDFKQSLGDDDELKEFIEALNHFRVDVTTGEVIGLDKKLSAGDRDYLYKEAVYCKEQFTKKLIKYQHSLKAQEFFVHCLTKIKSRFSHTIKPLIKISRPIHEVDKIVYDEILDAIYQEIGGLGLDLSLTEIQGMFYFLAGNCHIDWE